MYAFGRITLYVQRSLYDDFVAGVAFGLAASAWTRDVFRAQTRLPGAGRRHGVGQ